jgi:sugar lactone lactonase YvrE
MSDEVDLALDARAQLGEGPIWDPDAGEVVWVDIVEGIVHRTNPRTGTDTTLSVGRPIGSVALRRGGGLVLATDDGFRLLDPGATETRLYAPVEADRPSTRMNDGKVDPAGRFWAGTMARDEGPGQGTLYRLDADGTATAVVSPVSISNGLDWSDDGETMYYVDTLAQSVDTFRWDAATGALSDRRVHIRFDRQADGGPDGLTIDAEGFLWVAFWDGWCVRRYAPDGSFDREIRLPAARITSMTFGGPAYEDLYITSAWKDLSPAERAAQPHAGSLFHIRPGVAGRPLWRYEG